MKKRVLCALFAAALLATSVMAGCSGGEASANNTPSSSQADDSKNDASKAEDTESQASSLLSLGNGTLAALKATKVNSVSFEAKSVIRESAGFIYETDDGKFGVMPFVEKPSSTSSICEGNTLTPRMISMSSVRPCGFIIR